jgi:hypothetical protein
MPYFANIETIPHGAQRYDTVGDYWTDSDGITQFRVSHLGDWRMEFLIAIHEQVEKAITRWQGLSENAIDEFDFRFDREKKPCPMNEPGDCFRAPYHDAHIIATAIEALLAQQIGVNWEEYSKKVEAL